MKFDSESAQYVDHLNIVLCGLTNIINHIRSNQNVPENVKSNIDIGFRMLTPSIKHIEKCVCKIEELYNQR
jgi:hypothetical protein